MLNYQRVFGNPPPWPKRFRLFVHSTDLFGLAPTVLRLRVRTLKHGETTEIFQSPKWREKVFFSWSYHNFWPLEMIVWGYGLFSDRPKWGNVGYFLDWKFWKSKHGQKRQENHQAKTFRKKHRKSQDFALNKDTSLAKICVRKNTFSKYLTWLWNFYTSE